MPVLEYLWFHILHHVQLQQQDRALQYFWAITFARHLRISALRSRKLWFPINILKSNLFPNYNMSNHDLWKNISIPQLSWHLAWDTGLWIHISKEDVSCTPGWQGVQSGAGTEMQEYCASWLMYTGDKAFYSTVSCQNESRNRVPLIERGKLNFKPYDRNSSYVGNYILIYNKHINSIVKFMCVMHCTHLVNI